MAQATKGRLNYRCPECFKRGIDMDMFYVEQEKEYYCLRCCFRGSEEEVAKLYEEYKKKYGFLRERVVDFGADNEPPKFKKHIAGEQ